MKFWNSLPTWARGVVIVLVLVVLIYVGYQFKDLFDNPDEKKEKAKDTPVITPKTAAQELIKMKAKNDPHFRPTYSDTQFKSFADQLYEAMNHMGTNDSVIQNVFSKMYKVADVYALIEAYGVRQLKLFAAPDGAAGNLSQHLVSEGSTGAANRGLAKNKVYFSF